MTLTIQPNSSGSRELRLECQKSLHSTWDLVVRDFFKYKFQTFASVAQVVAQIPSYHRATESGEGLRLTVEGSQQVLNHLNTATFDRVIKGIVAETNHQVNLGTVEARFSGCRFSGKLRKKRRTLF